MAVRCEQGLHNDTGELGVGKIIRNRNKRNTAKNGNPYGSFNHYSYGAIAGWLIDSVCGIRCEDGRIRVAPKPDKRLGFADATYDSPLGRIRSGWKYEDGRFRYTVEIPANQTATICIPRSKPLEVSAGTYEFVS